MPKGPKGRRPLSIYESREAWEAKPARKRLNAVERRRMKAATLQLFIKQCGRRAHAGYDPNDRSYDKKTVKTVRHMHPDLLDQLLHGDED